MIARAIILSFLFAAGGSPVLAQGWSPPAADENGSAAEDDGLGLIQRGTEKLLGDLMNRAAPHLDQVGRDMSEAMSLLAPALDDLAALVDDVANYEKPERLENGDIIIRRKADAPPPPVSDNLPGLGDPDEDAAESPRPSPDDVQNPYASEIEL